MGMGSSFCFWFSQIGDEDDDHRCEDGWGRGKGLLDDASATGVEQGGAQRACEAFDFATYFIHMIKNAKMH